MYVLGIETSCDETAASIVKDGRRVLSNVVSSSLKEHKKYGGVVPEIASRMHLESITGVVNCSIKEAKIKLKNINLVSVTCGPGLAGSLLVGISFAKSLSLGLGVSLLGVNHLASHIYANFLNGEHLSLPFVALIVSGGHTTLFYVKDFDKIDVLGATCDDACGEAFDKVAKILGLGYPGGPLIERLAKSGNPKMQFSCSNTRQLLDFSFSGIKTAVVNYAAKNPHLTCRAKVDIVASFQQAVIEVLVHKTIEAAKKFKIKMIILGGGVASNSALRALFEQRAKDEKLKLYYPTPILCTDNAAMIAGAAYYKVKNKKAKKLLTPADFSKLQAEPDLGIV